jgi:hypothetical protein
MTVALVAIPSFKQGMHDLVSNQTVWYDIFLHELPGCLMLFVRQKCQYSTGFE